MRLLIDDETPIPSIIVDCGNVFFGLVRFFFYYRCRSHLRGYEYEYEQQQLCLSSSSSSFFWLQQFVECEFQ